jgi:branched-chain amino acid transport system substrate-binding protein
MNKRKLFFGVIYAVFLIISGVIGFFIGRMTVPAPVASPIKIGMTIALTGALSQDASYIKEGVLLFESDLNEKGGLLGRPIKVIFYDDESNPDRCVALYEKLIVDDKVDLIIGPFGSSMCYAMSSVAEKYKYPCLMTGGMADEIYARGFKYVFQVFSGTYQPEGEMHASLKVWSSLGAKTISVLNQDSAWPKSSAKGFITLAPQYGMEVVFHEEYPVGATDLSSSIAKMKQANADVVVNIGYYSDNALFTRQASEAGLTGKIIFVYLMTQSYAFYDQLKELSNNVMGCAQWVPNEKLPYPGIHDFIENYKKRYGRLPDQRSAIAYTTLQVICDVVEKVGTTEDKEAIREQILKEDFLGVFGAFRVNATGFQVAHKCVAIQWQNGKQEIIYPADLKTANPVYPFPGWAK